MPNKLSASENSLAIFSKASLMLAQADTIQKAKELKSLALTAAEWAKRKGMGEEAIQYCRSYAYEAERKMGEMLKAAESPAGRPRKISTHEVPISRPPTLAELGLTKKESASAQMLADLDDDEFEKVKTGRKTKSKAKKERDAARAKEALRKAAEDIDEKKRVAIAEVCDVRVCSCVDLFRSGIKPDAVITDPPYPKKFLGVFRELAEVVKDVPLVAVMVGQSYLPEVLAILTEHLKYRWTIAYLTPGGQSVQQFQTKVNCFWKPVLLFGESRSWIGDVASSDVNDNDKEHHHWGQSESGMADLVSRLTVPGQLICDPFVGGGTTAVVSLGLGRRFVGCDISAQAVDETWMRVRAAT